MTRQERSIRAEMLDAFVDGELPAEEAAALLRRIVDDPALAEEVAALSRLRAELRALELPADLDALDLDTLLAREPLRSPSALERVQMRALACTGAVCRPLCTGLTRLTAAAGRLRKPLLGGATVAAALVLAFFFLPGPFVPETPLPSDRASVADAADPSRSGQEAASLPALPPYAPAPSSPFIEAALARHMAWIARPAGTEDGTRLTAFARRHGRVYVPDLGATGLRISGTEDFGTEGVRVGYVGIHDCRLSLFILPADVGPELLPPSRYARGPARLVRWRAHRLDYLLVAAGMDPRRFDLVARAVIDATQALQPFGPDVVAALVRNHRLSQNCSSA